MTTKVKFNIINSLIEKMEIAKKCDANTKNEIFNNMKYFEMICASKQSLQNKIPVKSDNTSLKTTQEASSLKKEIESLDVLKDKTMEIIDKIFHILNDDNVVPQFLKVAQKKTTEKAILAENKEKYGEYFKELEALSTKIAEAKTLIIEKNKAFCLIKDKYFKPNEQNEKFFKEIESYVNLFNQKLVNISQGINFYSEFTTRMNDFNSRISDYLMARDVEKNELLKSITSGTNYNLANYNKPQEQGIILFNFYCSSLLFKS